MAGEKRPRFATCPRRFLTGRGPGQSRLRPGPGEVVCAQGAADDAIFYIEEGWVKISIVSPGGREAVLALRGADNFFGMRSLIDGHRRAAAASTLTACSLVRTTRTEIIRLLRSEPDFAEMFACYLALQTQRDEDSLSDHLMHQSERRLARTLLRLATDADGSERDKAVISIHVNQADLASMIGTTRSRVSYFMNKFRRQRLIDYDRLGFVTIHKALLQTLLEH